MLSADRLKGYGLRLYMVVAGRRYDAPIYAFRCLRFSRESPPPSMASQDQHLLMLGMINVSFIASALFDERANTVKLVDKIDSPFSPDWVTRHPCVFYALWPW
jgi:hypothetical protein